MATRAREPRVQLNLKLPAPLRDDIVEAARRQEVSINRFCEFGLAVYMLFLAEQHPPTATGD